MEPTLQAALHLAIGAVVAVLAVRAWPRRATPTGGALVVLLACASLGCVSYGALLVVAAPESRDVWSRLLLIGRAGAGPAALLAALGSAGFRPMAVRLGHVAALAALALVTIALGWSSDVTVSSPGLVAHASGADLRPAMLLSLVLRGLAIGALARAALLERRARRPASVAIAAAVASAWGADLWIVLGVGHVAPLHTRPLLDGITGLALAWALRHPMLDVARIARAQVVDVMQDAVLVVDDDGQLVDANPAANRTLGLAEVALPADLSEALAGYPEVVAGLTRDVVRGSRRLQIGSSTFDVQTTRVHDERGRFSGRIAVFRDVTGRREVERRVFSLAFFDTLTGLPNRQRFGVLLKRAIRSAQRQQQQLGLLFIDLDGFKRVNDTLGHGAGDKLLREVAARLNAHVRSEDWVGRTGSKDEATVSRLGGDEFTILMRNVTEPQELRAVAGRVIESLEAPFTLGTRDVSVSASIGIAVFPDHGERAATLIRHADTAMYHVKAEGRRGAEFYRPAMSAESRRRLALEGALRSAFEAGNVAVHYQPIRDLRSGTVVGAEALLRCEDPALLEATTEELISVAEQSELISVIGSWVLRRSVEQCATFQEAGLRSFRVAVNLSPNQLRNPEFAAEVAEILARAELSAEHLELEITERVLMGDDEATHANLEALRNQGVSLALDDFGTGYSSLSYLRRFPVDRVKVDRSFVAGIPDDAEDVVLTHAIIAMAHRLGLRVVAEGVEFLDQAEALREYGCDEVQGRLFSDAVPAEGLVRFLERDKAID